MSIRHSNAYGGIVSVALARANDFDEDDIDYESTKYYFTSDLFLRSRGERRSMRSDVTRFRLKGKQDWTYDVRLVRIIGSVIV